MVAVATLIITCPCALALAAPVAQVVASGQLFRQGIYLRSGDAFERLAEIDHIVFDKTGTLTLGEPKLVSMDINGRELALKSSEAQRILAAAASLARASHHPLSRALVVAAGAGRVLEGVREVSGAGLEAHADGQRWRLGSPEWVGADSLEALGPTLYFDGADGDIIRFKFEDQLQSDARETVQTLSRQGLDLEIVSGDRERAVSHLASQIGLSEWRSHASPQDKVARLEVLRAGGKKVLMVGDGLNDAGALSLAHASVAPGGAMDISQSASDAVYGGGLQAIPTLLRVSHHTRRVMQQNFALAALYNVIAVPIAVTGHVTPLIAAIAMSLSSILVTLNAMRLRLHQ